MKNYCGYRSILRRGLPSFVTLALLVVTQVSCSHSRQQNAEDLLREELLESTAKGRPTESHEELANTLKIPMARAQAIVIGPQAQDELKEQLGSATFNYHCGDKFCDCAGDSDCNDMFSTVCRDPATNGRCTYRDDGTVICYCRIAAQP